MKWSLNFRLWHWIHALVILGLAGTVLLRKTFLSWRTNSEILTQELARIDLTVTEAQAKVLAKAVRAPMWEWHILLGYALTALVVWRIILFFTQSGKQNYQAFGTKTLHKKLVALTYMGIYSLVFFMTISGLSIHFHETLGISKDLAKNIKEVHEFVFFYGVLVLVPLHLAGVIVAEVSNEKGIVSNMINGGNKSK